MIILLAIGLVFLDARLYSLARRLTITGHPVNLVNPQKYLKNAQLVNTGEDV
jgi:hypothetical protein